MKKLIHILFITILSIASAIPASALDLQEARSSGMLGEKNDGYIAVLQGSGEAQSLANQVNARRAEEYKKISQENGQPVDVVGKLAAKQIVQKLSPGSMYQDDTGSWKKK